MAKQNSKVFKNYSCLFCSNPTDPTRAGKALESDNSIILGDGDDEAMILKALSINLMPQNADISEQLSQEMFPFCTFCKDLVTELWKCVNVIRKTLLRLAEITTTIEKKVVDDVLEAMVFDDQMPSSAATSEKRFVKLRDVILKHYKETLIIKRNEKLKSIHLAKSSPSSVVSEVNTAEASCSLIISSSTKCEKDVNDATSNEYAEPVLPEVSISSNESSRRISRSLFDNDSLFEEEHHVLKSEFQSESEMEDLHEEKASDSGSEAEDQSCENQVVAFASPPGPSKPLQKTRNRMSNTGRSTQSSMAAQGKRAYQKHVTGKEGTFEGTHYKILKNKKIECGCCNHIYSKFFDFKRHVKKEIHQCSVCKKIFTRAYHLNRHHYKSHGAGANEKFSCPRCGSQYSRRYDLNKHLRNKCKGRISVE